MQATNFEPKQFRLGYQKKLFLSMIPSFIVDLIFLYRFFSFDPVFLNHRGQLEWGTLFICLLVNAVFLKSWSIWWYYYLVRYHLKRSAIKWSGSTFTYRKRLIVMSDSHYDYAYFGEYRPSKIDHVERKKDGSIFLKGLFTIRYLDEEQNPHNRKETTVKRLSIPSAFENQDEIYDRILRMVHHND